MTSSAWAVTRMLSPGVSAPARPGWASGSRGGRVEEEFLDGAFKGARAELGIVTLASEQLLGGFFDGEGEVLGGEAFGDAFELDIDNVSDLFLVEAMENDDVVDAVEEFGAEM